MVGSVEGFDGEGVKMEKGVFFEGFCVWEIDGFGFGGLDFGFGFLCKLGELCDVVVVCVGEEDGVDVEFFGVDEFENGFGVGVGIEDGGVVCVFVLDDVGVYCYVFEFVVEGGEVGVENGLCWVLGFFVKFDECVGVKLEMLGDVVGGDFVEFFGFK